MSAILQRVTLAMVNARIPQEVFFACALLAIWAMLLSYMDAKVRPRLMIPTQVLVITNNRVFMLISICHTVSLCEAHELHKDDA